MTTAIIRIKKEVLDAIRKHCLTVSLTGQRKSINSFFVEAITEKVEKENIQ